MQRGSFNASGLAGRFYDPNHREAGGVFRREGTEGAFSLARQWLNCPVALLHGEAGTRRSRSRHGAANFACIPACRALRRGHASSGIRIWERQHLSASAGHRGLCHAAIPFWRPCIRT
ncbi:MAG: hypothetical protein OXH79_00120 [Boseongicola sp.]|nr:hypothetical protein [Boseongicola sp.]